MALNLQAVRVIIYDLDGTIYDDDRHFALYAREIMARLPEEVQPAFWADWEAAVAGEHPALHVGTFYDVDRDLVLEIRGNRVVRALHWDGSEAPPLLRQQLYPDVVEPDHVTILNVGDLWWVPSAISAHHGGDREENNKAFLRIRELMSDPHFPIRPIPGLKELIHDLRGRVVQVLATNSPQPDSEAILEKVGLKGYLDRHFFRSNKPLGFRAIVEALAREHGVEPQAILSVGDNLVNEIAPAKALGCQTIFVDPHGLGMVEDADLIVPSMSRLIPALREGFGVAHRDR